MSDSQQSPLQEAISIVTIASILIAVGCYVAAINKIPLLSSGLYWIAVQVYYCFPALSALQGPQIPMLVSAGAVGGSVWILGMGFAGPLASWFSAGQLGRLERQTLKLKRNRARIQRRRRERDSFDVT